MAKVFEAQIQPDEMDYMEFLNYELIAYNDILEDILLGRSPKYQYSKDNYDHFINEYKKTKQKYSTTLNNLLEIYAPEFYGKPNYYVFFRFDKTDLMEIYDNKNMI